MVGDPGFPGIHGLPGAKGTTGQSIKGDKGKYRFKMYGLINSPISIPEVVKQIFQDFKEIGDIWVNTRDKNVER